MFNPCVAILIIRSGRAVNHFVEVNEFPVTIGRAANAKLRLDDSGIWEQHAKLTLHLGKGILLQPLSEGTVAINDQAITGITALRNGDIFQMGSVKCQFQLGPSAPRTLAWREGLVWLMLSGVLAIQFALIYWLR